MRGPDCANDPLYAVGDTMFCQKLARTFRRIAEDPFTFYNGSLAADISADIAEYSEILYLALTFVVTEDGKQCETRNLRA